MKFRKSKEQSGLFDFIERVQELSNRAGSLDKLNELIDFEVFRWELLEILDYGGHEKGGRPPWDPVLMLKVLIIQRYYNLSEEETEFQILDRFSFQRFLGLSVGDAVEKGQVIGTVGNSGTRSGVVGKTLSASGAPHLHFEIWRGGLFLGQGMTPDQVRHIYTEVLKE